MNLTNDEDIEILEKFKINENKIITIMKWLKKKEEHSQKQENANKKVEQRCSR